jgi:predicted enzyme related to lactoylglutathione lyase
MKKLTTLIEWLEIPVNNMERAISFYERILGIKLQVMPLGDLTMAFFPVEQSGIGGALCKHKDNYIPSENGVTIYLKADPDIDTMLKLIEDADGRIIQPKKLISASPEYGYMALFIDSEGNKIALYEK